MNAIDLMLLSDSFSPSEEAIAKDIEIITHTINTLHDVTVFDLNYVFFGMPEVGDLARRSFKWDPEELKALHQRMLTFYIGELDRLIHRFYHEYFLTNEYL